MDTTETKLKKHLLVTGLVRTGTTFLISYYSRLGFNTGYPKKVVDRIASRHHKIHGGLEILNHPFYSKNLKEVEVIKHPWPYAGRVLPWERIKEFNLTFEYIIITSRDFAQYAQSLSRSKVLRLKIKEKKKEELREKAFTAAPKKMRALKEWANKTNSTVIEVKFPDSVYDFEYLWNQLHPTFSVKNIDKEKAYKHWLALRNPDYVHFK